MVEGFGLRRERAGTFIISRLGPCLFLPTPSLGTRSVDITVLSLKLGKKLFKYSSTSFLPRERASCWYSLSLAPAVSFNGVESFNGVDGIELGLLGKDKNQKE